MIENDRVGERRRKLITQLVKIARGIDNGAEPFYEKKGLAPFLASMVSSTFAAVERDLIAVENGELPAPEENENNVSEKQRGVAGLIRKAKDDAAIDEAMVELAAGVLERTIDITEAKAAQMILMGRRFFLAQMKAIEVAKKTGGKIIAVPEGSAPPSFEMTG